MSRLLILGGVIILAFAAWYLFRKENTTTHYQCGVSKTPSLPSLRQRMMRFLGSTANPSATCIPTTEDVSEAKRIYATASECETKCQIVELPSGIYRIQNRYRCPVPPYGPPKPDADRNSAIRVAKESASGELRLAWNDLDLPGDTELVYDASQHTLFVTYTSNSGARFDGWVAVDPVAKSGEGRVVVVPIATPMPSNYIANQWQVTGVPIESPPACYNADDRKGKFAGGTIYDAMIIATAGNGITEPVVLTGRGFTPADQQPFLRYVRYNVQSDWRDLVTGFYLTKSADTTQLNFRCLRR